MEVMSPQVRVERMGPATVEDLPRYHALVERIDEVTNCWRSTGRLMGPVNVGDGYILEVQIPLLSRTGIFHVLFALFFLKLMILILQDLISSSLSHSFKPFHLLTLSNR